MTRSSPTFNKPMKFLVVDDVSDNRLFATWMLSHLGHSVAEAENGVQAVDMINETAYDIVLMDIQMPAMDGIEATRIATKLEGRKTHIIACTALDNPEIRKQARDVGMAGFITKPLNITALRALIESITRNESELCA